MVRANEVNRSLFIFISQDKTAWKIKISDLIIEYLNSVRQILTNYEYQLPIANVQLLILLLIINFLCVTQFQPI